MNIIFKNKAEINHPNCRAYSVVLELGESWTFLGCACTMKYAADVECERDGWSSKLITSKSGDEFAKGSERYAKRNNGVFEPESRLLPLVIPLVVVPAGCVMFIPTLFG